MEPETLEEQPLKTERTIVQDYTDHLYDRLVMLDLTDDHQHTMAYRVIGLIARVQEVHRDLDNPSGETKLPSFKDFFADLSKRTNLFEKS